MLHGLKPKKEINGILKILCGRVNIENESGMRIKLSLNQYK